MLWGLASGLGLEAFVELMQRRRTLAQERIDDRHDEQRPERGEGESADHRAPQWCVLLTRFAQSQSQEPQP